MRIILALLGAAAALAAQGRPNADPPNPLDGDPAAIEAGRTMYTGSCGGCHGATGEGGRGPNLRDGKLIRRSTDFQVMETIRKGVPGTDMPGSNLSETQLWQLVAFVRAMGLPAADSKVPGDPANGERVYARNGCSNCHSINGRGGALGPDLSNAGATRSLEYLREAVLKPGDRIAPGFQPVVVKTKDGRSIEGVARNYTNYSVQITDRRGELHLLQTGDLSDVQVRVATLMPADYSKRISRTELMDLLAYLSRQFARPVEPRQRGTR